MSTYHPLAYSRDYLDSELTTAVRLLTALVDEKPCRLRADGYCQTHQAETAPGRPCPHSAGVAFLEEHLPLQK